MCREHGKISPRLATTNHAINHGDGQAPQDPKYSTVVVRTGDSARVDEESQMTITCFVSGMAVGYGGNARRTDRREVA